MGKIEHKRKLLVKRPMRKGLIVEERFDL